MGREAVPEIQLPPRPDGLSFTRKELLTIPRSAHGKIIENQADWAGFYDTALDAVKGYRAYLERLFKVDEVEAERKPPKRWWQLWK